MQACTCVSFAPSSHQPISSSGCQSSIRLHEKSRLPCLVAGYSDGTIRVFDPNKVEMIIKMHPHAVSVSAVCYSTDGMSCITVIVLISLDIHTLYLCLCLLFFLRYVLYHCHCPYILTHPHTVSVSESLS